MADLKLALALNAVSPGIGGVLVRGEKGTAKSTVVRALAALLPVLTAVAGCRFGCDPSSADPTCPDGPHAADAVAVTRRGRLVELPVGAAEDRVVGSLDLERALTEGVRAFEPGLLAAAHRGVLYVDEVNLLHDHLVDVLLDAAAMGRCYVEREGVSVTHAARFLLVGTMNPEEGELRPQLLDRFGLTVHVAATREPAERAEVVRRGLAFEADPAAFAARWAAADAALAERIVRARGRWSRRSSCPTPSCCGSRPSARPSGSTGCAPTSSPRAPRSRTPPGTGAPSSPRRTSRRPRACPCRTAAAATRSTPRGSTRTSSRRRSPRAARRTRTPTRPTPTRRAEPPSRPTPRVVRGRVVRRRPRTPCVRPATRYSGSAVGRRVDLTRAATIPPGPSGSRRRARRSGRGC